MRPLKTTLSRYHSRLPGLLLIAAFLISLLLKLYATRDLVWDMDYVPLIALAARFFDDGAFPAHGTLSSVAAYNMPFLVWMQMPVMAFSRDIPTVLITTGLIWNAIGTWALYRTGATLFRPSVGLAAAVLFTFSETGISSSYTAWAQLTLPTFTALAFYCLWRWRQTGQGRYALLAPIIITSAFMTHFSAVMLYPAALIVVLLMRPGVHWRALIVGGLISLLLLAPYLAFQTQRDFVDLRAFLARETLVDPDVMAAYAYLKPEAGPLPASAPQTQHSPNTKAPIALISARAAQNDDPPTPPRWQRALAWLISTPSQFISALHLPFDILPRTLQTEAPALYGLSWLLHKTLWAALLISSALSLMAAIRQLRSRQLRTWITSDERGRYLLLLVFVSAVAVGLVALRAGPAQQPTYYTGLVGLELLLGVAGLAQLLARWHWLRAVPLLVVIALSVLTATERYVRIDSRDYDAYSPFTSWLYAPMHDAMDWIAADWDGGSDITVAYDILPENRRLWWIAPWHTVDPLYRFGAPYDVLLALDHGLINQNRNPLGTADQADYLLTYTSGLDRLDVTYDQQARFGPLVVLRLP